jgi:hypothetical protein
MAQRLRIPDRRALLPGQNITKTKSRETKNVPYLQSSRLSQVHFKLYISVALVYRLDSLFPIKLPEKRLISLYSLLRVWKSYLTPLLSRESLSRRYNILYLRRMLVRRRLRVR